MKIRLSGTEAECAVTTEALCELLPRLTSPVRYRIREVSRFYLNRGSSVIGRLYLDLDVENTTPDRHDIER